MARDDRPKGFAQAEIDEDGTPHVESVSESDEAGLLEEIMAAADKSLPDYEGEAALVDALEFGVRALVLIADEPDAESWVFPFRVPPESSLLELGKQYSSRSFLGALSEMPIIEGVQFREPPLEQGA